MTYQPTPTLDVRVGESRTWTVDNEVLDVLGTIVEVLDRIQSQLTLITEMNLEAGEKFN